MCHKPHASSVLFTVRLSRALLSKRFTGQMKHAMENISQNRGLLGSSGILAQQHERQAAKREEDVV